MHPMTHAQRVFTALSHQEPDRVPVVLTLTMHGAKELGLGIREYFRSARNVVEGQLRLQRKFGHDALYAFFHAPLEYEAWGGEVMYVDDGPPNSTEPLLRPGEPVSRLEPPSVQDAPGLRRVLETQAALKAAVGDGIPILGVVMSPFSVPVMQLGFPRYLELMLEDRASFAALMERNIAFCQAWGNAQLAAGATALAYFDPLASPTIVPSVTYRELGLPVAQRTLAGLQGPTVTHLASGRTLGVLDDLATTGTAGVGASWMEDLAEVKARCRGRLTVVGNLNGLAMIDGTPESCAAAARDAIAAAGAGGGFLLSDTHGEIPFPVPDENLHAICEAARDVGRYPLRLAAAHA